MVMLLSVCLYTKEIKKHKAISCSCMAGGNLSQSRRKEEKKKRRKKRGKKKKVLRTNKQTKKSEGLSGSWKYIRKHFWVSVLFSPRKESSWIVFISPLLSCLYPCFFLNLKVFLSQIHELKLEWNRLRNLGFGGAFSSPHPVLCYQTWCPTTTSLDQTSNVLLSTLTTVNYSFIALIFTSDVYFLRLYFTFW